MLVHRPRGCRPRTLMLATASSFASLAVSSPSVLVYEVQKLPRLDQVCMVPERILPDRGPT